MDAIATVIASVAIVVSLGTFALTYRASRQQERRSRMPILALFPEDGGVGWRLENIGNGAALNILIAQGHGPDDDGWIDLHANRARNGVAPGETWCNPIHLRPMSAGGSQIVRWQFETSGVGVSYTDALEHPYTVRTSERGSCLTERRCVPKWPLEDVLQLSDLEAMSPSERTAKESAPWACRS